MRDMFHAIEPVKTLAAAVYTGDQNGTGVDRQGFQSITHLVHVGASGDTLSGSVKVDFKLEESDDDSTYTAVSDTDHVLQSTTAPYQEVDTDGIFLTVDDGAEDDEIYYIGYRGNKRYSRVVADFTGTHTNGIEVAMSAIKGHPESAPTI